MHPNIDSLTREVISAALEVHRVLGPGFLESVYERALAVELTARQLPFVQQAPLEVTYRGRRVGYARVDLIVAEAVIVELKTVERFAGIHTAQSISYLKASGLRLALLINFNVVSLRTGLKRVVLDQRQPVDTWERPGATTTNLPALLLARPAFSSRLCGQIQKEGRPQNR